MDNQGKKSDANVLIIEDDDALRKIISALFRINGHEVITAGDGEEGLEKFSQHCDRVKLVITDLSLPKLEGPVLIQKIREMKQDVAIVSTSGYSERFVVKQLLENGADEFLVKPISTANLIRLMHRYLD